MNTTKVTGNCVLHVRQDSDTDLQHLFDSVLNQANNNTNNNNNASSVPFRLRKLPQSFFQPTSFGGGAAAGGVAAGAASGNHARSRSLPTDIGQMASPQDPNSQQQNFMAANHNHQRKHSHDALDSNSSNNNLPAGWEPRTTALGQKYFIKYVLFLHSFFIAGS